MLTKLLAGLAISFICSIVLTMCFGMARSPYAVYFALYSICFIVGMFILMALDTFGFLGVWACDELGWHKAPVKQSFDGCSFGGKCPRCGRPVLQDSQGDWFSIGEKENDETDKEV